MKFHTYFAFTNGLTESVHVPLGTLQELRNNFKAVEKALGCTIPESTWEKNINPPQPQFDEVLCGSVDRHNKAVIRFYGLVGAKLEQSVGTEVITPEIAATFWKQLKIIELSPKFWSEDYYRDRMEHLYEVLRGRESEGVTTWSNAKLTPTQAANVINLIASYLEPKHSDLRLDVPKGHDYLASSYDGGYEWCDRCKSAIADSDIGDCKNRRCPLVED
jgi:hypothetical protein